MSCFYTANGVFRFIDKESMETALLSMAKSGLIAKHNGNYGLFADSEEFHAVDVVNEVDLTFTLAFGMYENLLVKMELVLLYCFEWEFDFYCTDTPLVGSWVDGDVNLVSGSKAVIAATEGVITNSQRDAIQMSVDEFENKHETLDYYEENENALQAACSRVWAKPNHLNQ